MASGTPNTQGAAIIAVLEGGAFGETVGISPTSLAGFHGKAVAQAAAIATATDPATTMAAVNALLVAARAKGLIAP
jgi:hypothetical protein